MPIPMSYLTSGTAIVRGFYSSDDMVECLSKWADRQSYVIEEQFINTIKSELSQTTFNKIQVPATFDAGSQLNVVHYTNNPISIGNSYTLPYSYYGEYNRRYFDLVLNGNTVSYSDSGIVSALSPNVYLIIGSGMAGDPFQIQISNIIVDDYLYPIAYRLTNCTAPDAPAEAVVGSTVTVPFVFPDGYGIVNNENVYVTNNGVIVPSTYSGGVLTFEMPNPG